MKKFFLLISFAILFFAGYSQQENYSRLKIFLDGKDISLLQKTGIEINSGQPAKGWVVAELSASEIKKVAAAGFRSEVLISDMQNYYASRNIGKNSNELKSAASSSVWPVPAHFEFGSCGGFYTIDQMLAELDEMRTLFPDLISIKQVLSDTITTFEGRSVYYVKISDNPDITENEPEVLYTGMHHAREPIGMQHLIYYMWYLLENYSTNMDVKNVVDNTELYFVPVVNVDGYAYNIAISPWGNGMWRKNRTNVGGGNFGIDINRNYGYMWGYDDQGSSPDPSSDLYRGTGPFSESETRMMKYFCEDHNFGIALNYHSYSNLFLYPWGWTPVPTPDEQVLNAYGSVMTTENNYTMGPANTTIYPTNGGTDDWMYGEQSTKPKIFSYTPEVGGDGDGFWPITERIIPLCQENMYASFNAARLVGRYGKINDQSSLFIYQDNGYINFDVKRLGMQACDFTVSVQPLGSGFASVGQPVTFSGMDILEKRSDSISYQLAQGNHVGDTLSYVLTLDNGYYLVQDTVMRIYGYPYPLFSDKLDSKTNWNGNWGISTAQYYSPFSSMADSPFGNYGSGTSRNITLTAPVTLGPALLTVLEYRAKWAIEAGYDYVMVRVSDNNGSSWTPLQGRYTRPGGINQPTGQPLYDGMEDWVHEGISLNNWLNKNVKFQFSLVSDGATEFDGFYFDDFIISTLLDPTSVVEPGKASAWIGDPLPNPSSGLSVIQYKLPINSASPRIQVYNLSGQSVWTSPLIQSEGKLDINTEGWDKGVYLIQLETGNFPAQVKKLIVM